MGVEKIILGDDRLDFARKAMPYIPNASVEYVDDPDKLIEKVVFAEGDEQYSLIISDLEYGADKKDGLAVFREIEQLGVAKEARKVLWTARADADYVKEGVAKLGIGLLDKNQLGTLVGIASPERVLKKDGIVFLYVSDAQRNPYKTLKKVVGTLFDLNKINVGDNLKEALLSEKYGLIIDSSTLTNPDQERREN